MKPELDICRKCHHLSASVETDEWEARSSNLHFCGKAKIPLPHGLNIVEIFSHCFREKSVNHKEFEVPPECPYQLEHLILQEKRWRITSSFKRRTYVLSSKLEKLWRVLKSKIDVIFKKRQ